MDFDIFIYTKTSNMIETALGWVAIIWVLNSWAKQFVVPKYPKLERLMCLKCWSFWGTLAITYEPITAAVAALAAALLDKYLSDFSVNL